MKRFSGIMLALLGLTFGLITGSGVVVGKRYLIKEIVDSLNEEVAASCKDCSLTYDSFSISFLTLSGRATKVALNERGVARLTFDEITADFSINEILEKKIYLESLVLSEGHADGVGPDSATFRFINQITAPLPPEKQNEDRWRAILNTLEIRKTSLRESFGGSELVGKDLSLFVKRINDQFVLLPSLPDLRYRTFLNPEKTQASDLPLGLLSGSIVIEDGRTVFNSLKLGQDLSSVEIKGYSDTSNNDRMTGTAAYQLHTQYIGLPNWLQGIMVGQGSVSGSLGSPIISGSLSHAPEAPLTLAFPNASPIQFSSVRSDLVVDVNHGDPIISLTKITGEGADSRLEGTQPLIFSDEGLSAGFSVSLPSFTYGPFSVWGAKGKIGVKTTPKGTTTTFVVDANDFQVQGTSLGPAKLNVELNPSTIDVKLDSTEPRFGSLRWEGTINTEGNEPVLRGGKLSLSEYRHPLSTPPDPSQISPLAVSGVLPLSGPLDLARLSGEGATSITIPHIPSGLSMSGKTTLKDGVLSINLPVSAHKGSAHLKIDLVKTLSGKLTVALPSIPLSEFTSDGECGSIDASLDYAFSMSAPLAGNGGLSLGDLHLGCEPYVLRLPKNSTIPISMGALKFKGTKLSSGDTSMELNGSIGFEPGIDLSLAGDLHLSSLLPILPSVDNLRGLLSTKVAIKGPLSQPLFSGSAALSGAELAIASPDIAAQDVSGKFILADDTVRVESLAGSINNGSFDIKGSLLPFDWPNSKLTADLKEVTVEPMSDASITFSGQLALGVNREKRQSLSGNISVDFAEISKDFNLNRILVQTIKGYFLPTRIQPQVSKKTVALDLDVKVAAPRNIFVLTPFFSAELSADITAGGTTSDPAMSGSMQLLSGWIGLKGNRFDVTNGILTFKPGSLTPNIEIASEGVLRAPSGESVLVILEASGPLTSPRIALSSDRGLSQEELLYLITSSRSLTGRTMANRVGSQFGEDKRFFLSQESFSSFEAFFRNLTKFDTLSFEPTYNQYTGLVEPAVVGKKNLTPRFAVVGSSLFSSVSNSKAGVVYNLTPSLDINGFIQNVSTQENTILSSDLTYTILAEQPALVDITVEGERDCDANEIVGAARLGKDSKVLNNPESFATIQRDIGAYLKSQGFMDGSAELTCQRSEQFCTSLLITISEGPRFVISSIRTEGSALPEAVQRRVTRIVKSGDVASATILQDVERQLVLALRNEGYIAARVTPTFEPGGDLNTVTLVIRSDIREPISFVFSGNTVFSAEQFLDSIDFFSRKRPFGNNTVKLLVENIEQMYQARGYLFAQVSYSEDRSDPQRLIYTISIAEEAQTKVRALTITGNEDMTLRAIKSAMKDLGFADQIPLLSPTFAVPSELDTLQGILTSVFQQEGYPDVRVSYTIEPVEKGTALDITYRIVQGAPERVSQIQVQGFPSDIKKPQLPPTPISLPNLNQYVATLAETLQSEGYLFPSITTLPSEDGGTIELFVETGQRTIISSVSIDGLSRIDHEVAEKYLKLKAGNPYRVEDMNQTKRELLRSGLFSRVEVVPTDGTFDSANEGVTIRLFERALETLEVGTGANSEFGLHLFGEAVDKSIFSDGRTLSMRVDTYLDQSSINPSGSNAVSQGFANLRYVDPFFLDSQYSLTEELRFQRQELSTQEFNLDRLLLASYVFRQLDTGLTFTGGHSLTLDNLVDVTPGAIISDLDQGHVRLSFISGVLKLDRRDNPLTPQSGYTVTLEPRFSYEGIGSEANFGSIIARSTGILPLEPISPRWSLRFGLSGGISQPFGDTDQIPITQRFYLGGRTTVRGFRENSLGPRGSDNAVIGGDTMVAERNQLQYLVTDSLSSHLFLDLGNVFLRHESFSLGDIRSGTGAGFQYLSPIGPIGFDIGHPLDRQPGESTLQFHFSVGSAF